MTCGQVLPLNDYLELGGGAQRRKEDKGDCHFTVLLLVRPARPEEAKGYCPSLTVIPMAVVVKIQVGHDLPHVPCTKPPRGADWYACHGGGNSAQRGRVICRKSHSRDEAALGRPRPAGQGPRAERGQWHCSEAGPGRCRPPGPSEQAEKTRHVVRCSHTRTLRDAISLPLLPPRGQCHCPLCPVSDLTPVPKPWTRGLPWEPLLPFSPQAPSLRSFFWDGGVGAGNEMPQA